MVIWMSFMITRRIIAPGISGNYCNTRYPRATKDVPETRISFDALGQSSVQGISYDSYQPGFTVTIIPL